MMGIFDFVKSAGKKLGFGDDEAPDAEAIKKELDSHDLGSNQVEVSVVEDRVVLNGVVQRRYGTPTIPMRVILYTLGIPGWGGV